MSSSEDPSPVRWIGFVAEGHHTSVEAAKLSDGSVTVMLHTEKQGEEPAHTQFNMSPLTFDLMVKAINVAAHAPELMIPWDQVPKEPT